MSFYTKWRRVGTQCQFRRQFAWGLLGFESWTNTDCDFYGAEAGALARPAIRANALDTTPDKPMDWNYTNPALLIGIGVVAYLLLRKKNKS